MAKNRNRSLDMLNRRLLRIKAMQAVYALYQSGESNYELGLEEIADKFQPDLNSMEIQDPVLLKKKREEASELFIRFYKTTASYTTQGKDIIEAVETAKNNYIQRGKNDVKHFRKIMLEDVDNINKKYIELLCLLIEVSNFVDIDEEEKKNKLIKELPTPTKALKFRHNKIVDALRTGKNLEAERIRKNIKFEPVFVRTIFKEYIKSDELYIKYQDLNESSFEEDRDICLHILKNIFLKKAAAVNYFETDDLNWVENSSIVKSMAAKTVKSIAEKAKPEEILLEISANWEEDRAFFLELYDKSVEMDEMLEKEIAERLKNWDSDRVAIMDKIIMKLATAEMISFPSIPVKVSINEFIEISKIYSTPKSKVFVNGILDSLASDLTKKGTIKKSGRGLIDNK